MSSPLASLVLPLDSPVLLRKWPYSLLKIKAVFSDHEFGVQSI